MFATFKLEVVVFTESRKVHYAKTSHEVYASVSAGGQWANLYLLHKLCD